jgi:Tetrapyrrole (Corrin/Porphyrin) Methylases
MKALRELLSLNRNMTDYEKVLSRLQIDYDYYLLFLKDAKRALEQYDLTSEQHDSLVLGNAFLNRAATNPVWIKKTSGQSDVLDEGTPALVAAYLATRSDKTRWKPSQNETETLVSEARLSVGEQQLSAVHELVKKAAGLSQVDMPERQPFQIAIVGLGIMGVRHLTKEAENCIKISRETLYVDHTFGVPEFIGSLCYRSRNLLYLYQEGMDRILTYQLTATEVICAALDHPPVCFATYGHPFFYVYPSTLIRQTASLLGLNVHVVPGISAIDTALIDLAIDPGVAGGLQIYDATNVITSKVNLQVHIPCLLLQVDTVGSLIFSHARAEDSFVVLQQRLEQTYPPSHRVIAVFSSTFPILPPIKHGFPIAQLAEQYAQGLRIGTLYIPPI